jgi:hypothetical protein
VKKVLRIIIFLVLFWFVIITMPQLVLGQRAVPSAGVKTPLLSEELKEASEATALEELEASQASVVEKVAEKKDNITEPTPEIKGKLEKYLAEHPPKPLSVNNFIQHAIRAAIRKGVPANTIVLILLFPLIAAIIAASRHIIGIKGFGIFLPAVLSVAFVSTGIIEGILLFTMILIVATSARMILRKMKLEYLPRMALLLWFVSLGVLVFLFASPYVYMKSIMTLSIFPILILILTAENFISIHISMSMNQAIKVTIQTLLLAVVCSFIVQLGSLQKFVLLYPEISIVAIVMLDIFMGKYVGLRWLEHRKFRDLLK